MSKEASSPLAEGIPSLIWTARLLEMVARGHPLPRVLDELCRVAEDLIGDCWCGVVLVDPVDARLERAAAPSLPDSFGMAINGRPLRRDSGPNAMAAYLDEEVVSADLASDARWTESGWRAMALSHRVHACCARPIRSTLGNVIGAFAVYYRQPRTPTAAERTLMEQFTNLASIAIERARAEESILQGERQLAGENRLLEMIASGQSLPDVLTALCSFVEEAAPVCVCGVYPIDWSGPTFHVGAAPSLPESYTGPIEGLPVRCDVAPCGIAAFLDTQVIVKDIETDAQWRGSSYSDHVLAHGLRSVWSTPIHSHEGGVLGTFCVYQRKAGAPSSRQQKLIAQVTHIASIAIERAQAEAALRRSEAFLAQGEHLSQTGTFSWRVATDELKWSDETYRIFGVEVGTPVTIGLAFDRIHPEDAPACRIRIHRARLETRDLELEYRLRMADGSLRHVHIVAHPTRDRSGQVEYIGAVRDMTERRKSDDALARLRSELAHVARAESLGALTASIAHEVNQPLSGIMTNASTCLRMLAMEPPDMDGARETVRRTIRDGERASQVITRLRALFSKKTGASEPVDLNEATREVIALTLSELQRNRVIVMTEFADGLPAVSGDRVQLQQVILNLLLNANEAMSAVEDRPRELLLRTAREEDGVRLVVRDTGTGFDVENVKRLFESFYTTKSNGMGIGLSVSRSIIESHQGRLWAAPNDGLGATFSFSLPAAGGRAQARARPRPDDAEPVARSA
jgi:PAS domain S-box-containing protein